MPIRPLEPATVQRIRSTLVIASLSRCAIELVHNSIDAGATAITVSVDALGRHLTVADNGSGIPEADIGVIATRYATSKCQTLDDLSATATYGFRGEALASIADVSMVEIESKCSSELHGSYTIIKVPVRSNNQKPAEDVNSIRKAVEALSLVNHAVTFSVYDGARNRKLFSLYKTKDMLGAFRQIHGHALARSCAAVHRRQGAYEVEGLLSTTPQMSKATQYIFVNGWHLGACDLYKAVSDAFDMAELTRAEVSRRKGQRDQVSALVASVVQDFLSANGMLLKPLRTVSTGESTPRRQVLDDNRLRSVSLDLTRRVKSSHSGDLFCDNELVTSREHMQQLLEERERASAKMQTEGLTVEHHGEMYRQWMDPASGLVYFVDQRTGNSVVNTPLTKHDLTTMRILGQVDRKFICGVLRTDRSTSAAVVMIDQHAADERIRLEELLSEAQLPIDAGTDPSVATTPLPVPRFIPCSHSDLSGFRRHQRDLATWGFIYSIRSEADDATSSVYFSVESVVAGSTASVGEFQPTGITVTQVPAVAADRLLGDDSVLGDLIFARMHDLQSTPGISSTMPRGLLELLHSKACRSAIMFGDQLSLSNCRALVSALSRTDFPFQWIVLTTEFPPNDGKIYTTHCDNRTVFPIVQQ
ncbi:hypothetical protein RI367_004352 [Sorochytrium milnesiophthora]